MNSLLGYNGNKKSRKGRKKPRRSRNVGPQVNTMGHVYRPLNGPIFAPQMPREFSAALHYSTVLSRVASTTDDFLTLGVVEFLSRRPKYAAELFAMYRYCRITACTLQIDISNQTTTPIRMAIAEMPFNSTPTSVNDVEEMPGAKRRLISAQGGIDRTVLTMTVDTQRVVGNPNFSKYWFDEPQSLLTVPLDTNEPIFVVATGRTSSANYTCFADYKLTWHCQFFDLRFVA